MTAGRQAACASCVVADDVLSCVQAHAATELIILCRLLAIPPSPVVAHIARRVLTGNVYCACPQSTQQNVCGSDQPACRLRVLTEMF